MLYSHSTSSTRFGLRALALATLTLTLSVAQAQQASGNDAARDALGKREGDVDQAALLKETLTASDKQYSLLKKGKWAATYDLNYSYTGQQQIDAKFTDSTLTLFKIENTRAHTITNTVSVDYGLRDNLTGNVSLPLVSKYSESSTFSGMSHGFGDLNVGARWQPFEMRRDAPSITTSATVRLPTGRSPYRSIDGQNLSTGSGTAGLTLGVNASKIIDPIALFGSASVGVSMPARHINQVRDNVTLVAVHPGPSLTLGGGFAYALSYDVSTTMSLQESLSFPSKLVFEDGTSSRTSVQTSGMFSLGLGVRTSPQNTINMNLGIGLTSDSPDFTLGMNMPLSF
ncbi:MAG TPA: transporter [Aquabacterium sp.]|uniref:transporter n=1 Tax=Aquabacterium sp. TaxID=1872578 RepID=UPI002E343E63|nr:transporter [Aquabacterium sp.]HEX5355231.1 transporter [Aquabacterium sp.]